MKAVRADEVSMRNPCRVCEGGVTISSAWQAARIAWWLCGKREERRMVSAAGWFRGVIDTGVVVKEGLGM